MADLMPAKGHKGEKRVDRPTANAGMPLLLRPSNPSHPSSSSDSCPPSGTRVYRTGVDAVSALYNRYGPYDDHWWYTDAQGEPLGIVARWDRSEGKEIRPVGRRW